MSGIRTSVGRKQAVTVAFFCVYRKNGGSFKYSDRESLTCLCIIISLKQLFIVAAFFMQFSSLWAPLGRFLYLRCDSVSAFCKNAVVPLAVVCFCIQIKNAVEVGKPGRFRRA